MKIIDILAIAIAVCRLSSGVFAFCLLTFLFSPAVAQSESAFVLEVNGNWYSTAKPKSLLRQGQSIPFRSIVRAEPFSSNDKIVVIDSRGNEILSANCANGCSNSFSLNTKTRSQPTLVGEIYNSVMSLIFGSPNRYSLHRSRGDDAADLVDGVARLDNGKLDLSGVLTTQRKYYLRWRTVPASDSEKFGEWSQPSVIEINQNQLAISNFESKPGLYEFNLMKPDVKKLEATPTLAWILITAPQDYEKTAASFQKALDQTQKWGDKVKDSTKTTFLLATLDNLARQNASDTAKPPR